MGNAYTRGVPGCQTLQVSRISRETHAFDPILCVSRRETHKSHAYKDWRGLGEKWKKYHISASTGPTEIVHLSKFAGFSYESNRMCVNVLHFVVS